MLPIFLPSLDETPGHQFCSGLVKVQRDDVTNDCGNFSNIRIDGNPKVVRHAQKSTVRMTTGVRAAKVLLLTMTLGFFD